MLTINELFAGIGSQSAALKRLGIEFKVVGIAEIDKDATLSYAAIHCDLVNKIKTYDFPSNQEMAQYLTDRNIGYDFKKNKPRNWFKGILDKITGKATKELKRCYLASILSNNYGDISKIEKLEYADFWTYSFPCQDISVAGKQAGIEKGKTRSGLLYEVERLLEKSKECGELPKYLMLENVKNLVGKKFKPQFEEWTTRLDELGYNTYWQVLNAKNYGIPQNRERVFGISIRKDIDTGYVFPEPFELNIRLKDILEDEVDEKYYLSGSKAMLLIQKLKDDGQLNNPIETVDGGINEPKAKDISNCIKARYDCGISNQRSDGTMVVETLKQKRIGGLYDGETKHQAGSVWDTNYIAPTVDTMQGGNRQPCVLIHQATKQGYIEQEYASNISDEYSFVKSKCQEILDEKGSLPEMFNPYHKAEITDIAPTQTTSCDRSCSSATVLIKQSQYRIRKLTPLECWRLMGFTDEQFYRAEKTNSNSQLYKQAGNSIVVDVLYYLFKNLFINKPTD